MQLANQDWHARLKVKPATFFVTVGEISKTKCNAGKYEVTVRCTKDNRPLIAQFLKHTKKAHSSFKTLFFLSSILNQCKPTELPNTKESNLNSGRKRYIKNMQVDSLHPRQNKPKTQKRNNYMV